MCWGKVFTLYLGKNEKSDKTHESLKIIICEGFKLKIPKKYTIYKSINSISYRLSSSKRSPDLSLRAVQR